MHGIETATPTFCPMADYHNYIYDTKKRQIVGDFEGAYRNCEDTWPSQHDVHLHKYQSVLHLVKKLGPTTTLADIGCGYGDYVALLRQHGVNATGYEIAAAAVEKGRERFKLGEHIQVGDLTEGIPAPAASYDVVVLFGVFWFLLNDLDHALGELCRLLRPGGTLVASISMVNNPIGGEVLSSYEDYIRHLRRRFVVSETALYYDAKQLQASRLLAECSTDMVAYCHVAK